MPNSSPSPNLLPHAPPLFQTLPSFWHLLLIKQTRVFLWVHTYILSRSGRSFSQLQMCTLTYIKTIYSRETHRSVWAPERKVLWLLYSHWGLMFALTLQSCLLLAWKSFRGFSFPASQFMRRVRRSRGLLLVLNCYTARIKIGVRSKLWY